MVGQGFVALVDWVVQGFSGCDWKGQWMQGLLGGGLYDQGKDILLGVEVTSMSLLLLELGTL